MEREAIFPYKEVVVDISGECHVPRDVLIEKTARPRDDEQVLGLHPGQHVVEDFRR